MPLTYILEALGGLGLFVLGMKTMSDGLQKIAGERLRRSLEKITGNRLTAALMGSCLSSLLQSSSAASILVIGFVNAGLISLYQALGVLLGTTVGTTIAVQFIAFKVTFFALPAVFIGVFLKYFGRRRKWVNIGELFLGAGLLFLGLKIMNDNLAPLQQTAIFRGHEVNFYAFRLSAALFGALLTFLVQSGSTAIGIIIALATSGLLSLQTGAAMAIGEVIGTSCIAAIGSIGGTLEAKRTVFIYFLISVFAVAITLLLFPSFLQAVHLISPDISRIPGSSDNAPIHLMYTQASFPEIARHIANAHTLFSCLIVLIFLPMLGFLARTAPMILPGKEDFADIEPRPKYIDTRIINTPTIAFLQVNNEVRRMARIASSMYTDVERLFHRYDAKKALRIKQKEDVTDILQRDISDFLVSLSRQQLSMENSLQIPIMLHITSDLEHIGDQSEAIVDFLRRKKEEKLYFSNLAISELKTLASRVGAVVALAVESLENGPDSALDDARGFRDEIRQLQETMINNHITRLSAGKCTVLAGIVYSDMINAFVKIMESSFNIIETKTELRQ